MVLITTFLQKILNCLLQHSFPAFTVNSFVCYYFVNMVYSISKIRFNLLVIYCS